MSVNSFIQNLKYDKKTETLTITFTRGDAYTYEHFSEKLYEQFKAAPSKGTFYNTFVKGHYEGQKIT